MQTTINIAEQTVKILENSINHGWLAVHPVDSNLHEVFFGEGEDVEALTESFDIDCANEDGVIIEISSPNPVFWDEKEACFRPSSDDEITSLNWRFFFLHEKGYTALIDFDQNARLRPLFPTPAPEALAQILKQFLPEKKE